MQQSLICPITSELVQWFKFVFFCVQTESSDEDEASGDEGLPHEDSDVSSVPNRPPDQGGGGDQMFIFCSLLELGGGGGNGGGRR